MITHNRILIITLTTEMVSWVALESISMSSAILVLVLLVQVITIILYLNQRKRTTQFEINNKLSNEKNLKKDMLNQTTTYKLLKAQNLKLQQLRLKVNGLERVIRDQHDEIQHKNDELNTLSGKAMRLADYFAHNLKSTSSTLLGLINIEQKIQGLKDQQVVKKKIKSFAESLHKNLSSTTELLAEETPLHKVSLPELINEVIQTADTNFKIHVSSKVKEVLTNASILAEVILVSLKHFQSGMPKSVRQELFITVEESENFWTIKMSKSGFNQIDDRGSKINNIDRSKILVDKLYGRLDCYSNLMSDVDCIKLTFPIMSKDDSTDGLEDILFNG